MDATAEEFDTEMDFDYLTIGDTGYTGQEGPLALSLGEGAALVWSTDGSEFRSGFKVCAAEPGAFAIAVNLFDPHKLTHP